MSITYKHGTHYCTCRHVHEVVKQILTYGYSETPTFFIFFFFWVGMWMECV